MSFNPENERPYCPDHDIEVDNDGICQACEGEAEKYYQADLAEKEAYYASTRGV